MPCEICQQFGHIYTLYGNYQIELCTLYHNLLGDLIESLPEWDMVKQIDIDYQYFYIHPDKITKEDITLLCSREYDIHKLLKSKYPELVKQLKAC